MAAYKKTRLIKFINWLTRKFGKARKDFDDSVPYIEHPIAFRVADIIPVSIYPKTVKIVILMGRKHGFTTFQFIGGFIDPTDFNSEHGAARELMEEANLHVDPNDLKYLGSFKVDDSRYRKTKHRLITSVYRVDVKYSNILEPREDNFPIAPGDDIVEVRWIELDRLRNSQAPQLVREVHLDLMSMLCDSIDSVPVKNFQ